VLPSTLYLATPTVQEKPLVLIVDDQPTNIQALAAILGGHVRSIFALSGEAALIKARETQPDLILLDVMLPGIDGFQVCETLKADPSMRDVPVIFVSGLTDGLDEERGFKVGGVDYVHKPFLPDIVKARVNTHLKLRAVIRELAALARMDELTGLANRRYFDERAEIELDRSRRHQLPLALMMVDIDRFKSINDQGGHSAGDRVLQHVAQTLGQRLTRMDIVARYGGEEFVLLLPSMNGAQAVALAESIRLDVAALQVHSTTVTVSIGVTEFGASDDLSSMLERGDQALYQAKHSGRNRVVQA
jgi:diguanylate cyclase (GGDEF)-like protein